MKTFKDGDLPEEYKEDATDRYDFNITPDPKAVSELDKLNSVYQEAYRGLSDSGIKSLAILNYWSDEVPPESLISWITNQRFNADSKILLKGIPDESVDLVLTDPPYDFDFVKRMNYIIEFMRISKHGAIIFCPPENTWKSDVRKHQNLFWIKPISTKNTSKHYSRFVEQICVIGNVKFNAGRHWSQYTNVFTDLVDDATLHAFRKPPSLIEKLILNHTDPGDIILDPFAGSFVVADVAERLGRKHISIEIDKDLYERYGHGNNV